MSPPPPADPSPARRTLLVMAVVAGLLAASCGGDRDSDDRATGDGGLDDPRWETVEVGPELSDATPTPGGSLVVGMADEPPTLAPPAWRSIDFNLALAIFDPLVIQAADGTFRPYLAEALEPDDDFDEWTLTLRPDVRFHDGTRLDAEALKRSWDDHLADGYSTSQVSSFVERVEVDDELTVTYVLAGPHAQFPEVLTLPMGWPFSPDAADELGEDFGEQPVGTGPYKLVSWERDHEIVLERNDDYWQDGQPYLDEITFRHMPDDTSRAQALETGEVDAVQGARLSPLAADLADLDGTRIVLGETNNGRAVIFNTAEAPTDDIRVRQALAHAVDQEPLVPVLADDAAALTEVRTQFFPSNSPFYSEAVAEAWPAHDPDEARLLHDDYATDPDRSDGQASGEPVQLTLTVVNRPADEELAEAYAAGYRDAGFDVTVETITASDVAETVISGSYVAMLAGVGENRSPLGEFELSFSADLITNYTNFNDPTVDALLGELRVTEDHDRQAQLTEEMGLHLAEQMPVHWLASSLTFFAADENVRGFRSWELPDGTLGTGTGRSRTMWGQIWVDD